VSGPVLVLVLIAALYLAVLLHFPIYYVFWHIFRESAGSKLWWQTRWRQDPRRLLLALLVIPLVWGVSAGIVFAILHA
jgi:ABC-type sulfate transport system permease subunit